MNVLIKIQEIFRDIFDDENLLLTRETTADDVEEWDSLNHINIVVACEDEFRIKFDLKDATQLKSVGDMVDIIERKLQQ